MPYVPGCIPSEHRHGSQRWRLPVWALLSLAIWLVPAVAGADEDDIDSDGLENEVDGCPELSEDDATYAAARRRRAS